MRETGSAAIEDAAIGFVVKGKRGMPDPIDMTPPHLRCGKMNCPSINRMPDGSYEITGALISVDGAEAKIRIPGEYLELIEAEARNRKE
jgi:hypothetical protein